MAQSDSFCQWPGRLGLNHRSGHIKECKKWPLIPPGFTLSITKYVSRVKWSNLVNGVAPIPKLRCSTLFKKEPWVNLNYGD